MTQQGKVATGLAAPSVRLTAARMAYSSAARPAMRVRGTWRVSPCWRAD